jgi:hypothetical protein
LAAPISMSTSPVLSQTLTPVVKGIRRSTRVADLAFTSSPLLSQVGFVQRQHGRYPARKGYSGHTTGVAQVLLRSHATWMGILFLLMLTVVAKQSPLGTKNRFSRRQSGFYSSANHTAYIHLMNSRCQLPESVFNGFDFSGSHLRL